MKTGPIVLIEDDVDDKDLVMEALAELNTPNEVHWFNNCPDAWTYLKETSTQPFVIICDVNLPMQTGMEFKQQIDGDPQLRQKSIPFILYSTSDDRNTVLSAYTLMTVQGYFKKESSFSEVVKTLETILNYWERCKHPNSL